MNEGDEGKSVRILSEDSSSKGAEQAMYDDEEGRVGDEGGRCGDEGDDEELGERRRRRRARSPTKLCRRPRGLADGGSHRVSGSDRPFSPSISPSLSLSLSCPRHSTLVDTRSNSVLILPSVLPRCDRLVVQPLAIPRPARPPSLQQLASLQQLDLAALGNMCREGRGG